MRRRTNNKNTTIDDHDEDDDSAEDVDDAKETGPPWLVSFWFHDAGLPPLGGIVRGVFYSALYGIYLCRNHPSFPLFHNTGIACFSTGSCTDMLRRFQHYYRLEYPMKRDAGLYGPVFLYLLKTTALVSTSTSTVTSWDAELLCAVLTLLFHMALVCCAVGVGNKLPRILVCVLWWTGFGLKMSSWNDSVGHTLYVPGVALFALCFTENNVLDPWSLDAVLYQKYSTTTKQKSDRGRVRTILHDILGTDYPTSIVVVRNKEDDEHTKDYQRKTRESNDETGGDETVGVVQNPSQHQHRHTPVSGAGTAAGVGVYLSFSSGARKFLLCVIAVIMFNSGLHKLVSHGILPTTPNSWWDGQTIYHAIVPGLSSSSLSSKTGSFSLFLKHIIAQYPVVATLMASSSILGEVFGAILIVTSPRYRPYGIVLFICFHIGIFLVMVPNFVLNIVTYMLVMNITMDLNTNYYYQQYCSSASPLRTRTAQLWTRMIGLSSTPSPRIRRTTTTTRQPPPYVLSSYAQLSSHNQVRYCVGAWCYTLMTVVLFGTSLCGIDYFPLYSWSLYSWHPPTVDLQPPFTIPAATHLAYRSLTTPPYNPTHRNLGGSRHHDIFPRYLKNQYKFVMIIKEPMSNAKNTKYCRAEEYAVYKNWKEHMCLPSDVLHSSSSSEDDGLKQILWKIVRNRDGKLINKYYGGNTTTIATRKPRPLKFGTTGNSTASRAAVINGFTWRILDSIAASINDDPNCFKTSEKEKKKKHIDSGKDNITEALWNADPSPLSPSSKLSRRLRDRMNIPYYMGTNRSIVGIGMFVRFLNKEEKYRIRYCMLGLSTKDEPRQKDDDVLSYITGRYGTDVPYGDFSKIQMSILVTTLIAMIHGILYYNNFLGSSHNRNTIIIN